MNRINFQSENLEVDWVGLYVQDKSLGLEDLKIITSYLSKLGFNVVIQKGSLFEDTFESEDIFNQPENKWEVTIIDNVSKFYKGTHINFSGKNGAFFYNLIKINKIDWAIFDKTTKISRFDLSYLRKPTLQDTPFDQFVISCLDKNFTKKNQNYQKTKGSILLSYNSRKSSRYFRIYQKKDCLRFELEFKKTAVNSLQVMLVSTELNDFENEMSNSFYDYFLKIMPLETIYTDWLLIGARNRKLRLKNLNCLVSSYFNSGGTKNKDEYLFNLLQFLSFIRSFVGLEQQIGDQNYYLIKFLLRDFLIFTGKKPNNKYQLRKSLEFIKSLQKLDPIVEKFSGTSFKSFLVFPYLTVNREKKLWVVKISIIKHLYFYNYPFLLPKEFFSSSSSYELKVRLELIKSISVVSPKKKFCVYAFFNKFSISNKNKTKLKKLIVDSFDLLVNKKIIDSFFILILKNEKKLETKKITTSLLTKSFHLYFYESPSNFSDKKISY